MTWFKATVGGVSVLIVAVSLSGQGQTGPERRTWKDYGGGPDNPQGWCDSRRDGTRDSR